MLLNAGKCQGYSFYLIWVIKGKPTGWGGKITHPSTGFAKSFFLDIWMGCEYVSVYLGFFLLLSVKDGALNLPRIFLMWLVFYLSI